MCGSNHEKLTKAKAALLLAAADDNLRVKGIPDGQGGFSNWRTTLAGTTYLIITFNFKIDNLWYELHVHGGKNRKINDTNADAKVCGANLKGGESRLSSEDWMQVKAKVKALVGQ